jgi:hypothetical protein
MALFGIEVKDIGSAVSSIGTVAKDLRAAITGKSVIDPAAQAAIEQAALSIEAEVAKAQLSVNAVEAANPKLFVSGWRPAIGWTIACALFWEYIARRLLMIFKVEIPSIPLQDLIGILFAMLGMTASRTAEKFKGVARE